MGDAASAGSDAGSIRHDASIDAWLPTVLATVAALNAHRLGGIDCVR